MLKLRDIQSLIVHRMPAGIAAAPFEFAAATAYLAEGAELHIDPTTHAIGVLLLGSSLAAWTWVLIAGSALVMFGLLLMAKKAILGLQFERIGLIMLCVVLVTYIFAVYERTATIGVVFLTTIGALLACIFKVVSASLALDKARRADVAKTRSRR